MGPQEISPQPLQSVTGSVYIWWEQHGSLGQEHDSDNVPFKVQQLENKMHIATVSSSVGGWKVENVPHV